MKYKYFKVFSRVFCAAVTPKFGAALEETVQRCTVHACTVPGAGMLSKGPTHLGTVYREMALQRCSLCPPCLPVSTGMMKRELNFIAL